MQWRIWNREASFVKSKAKRIFIKVFFLNFIILMSYSFAEEKIIDRIEVKVNNEIITKSEIDRAHEHLDPSFRAAREEIRDKLIVDVLIREKLTKISREATDKSLEKAVNDAIENQILKKNNMTEEDLRIYLEKQGKTPEGYREEIREDLRNKRNEETFVNVVVRPKLRDIDEETLVSEHNRKSAHHERHMFRLAVILLRFTKETKQDKKELLQKIHPLLTNENFSDYAKKYSESATSDSGGDMGLVNLTDLHEGVRNALKDLKENEISPIIEVKNSLYVFRIITRNIESVSDKKFVKNIQEIDEVERNTLMRDLQEREISTSIESWVNDAKTRAYIEILHDIEKSKTNSK